MEAPSVGQRHENQLVPPLSKTPVPSLTELLHEVENWAKKATLERNDPLYTLSLAFKWNVVLVKALRELWASFEHEFKDKPAFLEYAQLRMVQLLQEPAEQPEEGEDYKEHLQTMLKKSSASSFPQQEKRWTKKTVGHNTVDIYQGERLIAAGIDELAADNILAFHAAATLSEPKPETEDGAFWGHDVREAEAGLTDAPADNAQAALQITRLRDALEEIAEGKGPFSRDPLTHASHTIDAMKELAHEALAAPSVVASNAVLPPPVSESSPLPHGRYRLIYPEARPVGSTATGVEDEEIAKKIGKQLEQENGGRAWNSRPLLDDKQYASFILTAIREAKSLLEPTINNLRRIVKDGCEDEEKIKELARPFLGDLAVDGDSYGVPMVVDIVEALIKKLSPSLSEPKQRAAVFHERLNAWLAKYSHMLSDPDAIDELQNLTALSEPKELEEEKQ